MLYIYETFPPTNPIPQKTLIKVSWERNEVRFFPQAKELFLNPAILKYLNRLFNLSKEAAIPPKDGVSYFHSQCSMKEFAC